MSKFVRSQAFDVFRPAFERWNNGDPVWMDTVFYAERVEMTEDEVRRELIDHDGYPDYIWVKRAK